MGGPGSGRRIAPLQPTERTRQVLLRVSCEEHAGLERAARLVGMTVGPFMRMAALREMQRILVEQRRARDARRLVELEEDKAFRAELAAAGFDGDLELEE